MCHSPELLVTQRTSNALSPGLPFQAAFGGKGTRQNTGGILLTLYKAISKKPKYFLRNKFKDDENNRWL